MTDPTRPPTDHVPAMRRGRDEIPLTLWGSAVRLARHTRGLSQAELAHRIDVGQQTISKIERGAVCPTDEIKVSIAAALEVAVGDLFPWPDLDGRYRPNAERPQ